MRGREEPDEPPEPNWRILLHRLKQTGGCLIETHNMRVKHTHTHILRGKHKFHFVSQTNGRERHLAA